VTDLGLVAKKLARIEACLQDLARVDPARIESDVVTERFVEHTLQIAIQAALDIASHIVSDDRLGEPGSNHALFDLLARAGWLPAAQVSVLHRMVGFRNVLVHEYDTVDLRMVRRVVERHAGDLQAFVDAIRLEITTRSAE
jgi:uncharacterized protein YutE (UPF0331/DUF86 family)